LALGLLFPDLVHVRDPGLIDVADGGDAHVAELVETRDEGGGRAIAPDADDRQVEAVVRREAERRAGRRKDEQSGARALQESAPRELLHRVHPFRYSVPSSRSASGELTILPATGSYSSSVSNCVAMLPSMRNSLNGPA